MKNNEAIQLGSNRYLQGCGVLGSLGEEAAALGRHPLILADRQAYPKVSGKVEASLSAEGIKWELMPFEGRCCPANYQDAANRGRISGCDMVIGIGGGRALDTAKIAADRMGVRAVTIPTSAATCAATALLAVHYSDEGKFLGNYWPRYAPAVTLADLDIIIKDCPPRLNAAGIVDAMAKYPEIAYNILYTDNWEKNIMSYIAQNTAENTFHFLMEHGRAVGRGDKQKEVGQDAENVVAAVLSITGFISCLACGGKQAAVSHGLYSYFCNEMPALTSRFLHGELVGASLPYQMALNGWAAEDVGHMRKFLNELSCPSSLSELGLKKSSLDWEGMAAFLYRILPARTQEDRERLEKYKDILF